VTDLPGSLGTEPSGGNSPGGAPGWFGGAIDRAVNDLADRFGADRLPSLWIEVWIYAREPDDLGWILRDVRPAGAEPPAWRKPAVTP
jgi:hypothetical protein